MRWHEPGQPWQLAKRVDGWSGDTSALGEPLPPGCTVAVAADAQAREFHIWCYSPGNEFHRVIPYAQVIIEGGAQALPDGKLHTTGQPTASWHGNQIKLFGKGWGKGFGQPDYLYRVYTWITLIP